ncbi:MAG: glycosyltransferase [Acholeplasmataceae bacterium]|nr:glycosyltransferase [Acholeplasmataceae bacterium]
MLKILFVIPSLTFGGAERVISLLANNLQSKKYKISILLISNCRQEYKINRNVQVINIEDKIHKKLFLPSWIQRIGKIRTVFKTTKPDIIVSFLVTSNIYSCVANLFLNSKLIISERNDPHKEPKSIIKRMVRKLVYPMAQGFVFQTSDAMHFFNRKIQNKGVVIPNPVIDNLPIYDIRLSKNKIVTIGRLEKQKNQILLLEAFHKFLQIFPDYSLHVFGNGSLSSSLKEKCNELRINENVIFEGVVDDVHSKILDAKMFILTSDYEGMPNSLIESMAIGIPSISTDSPIGGPKMLITNEFNGILIPVKDKNKLISSMTKLANDFDYCKFLSENAKNIRKIHSLENIILLYDKYFKVVIER